MGLGSGGKSDMCLLYKVRLSEAFSQREQQLKFVPVFTEPSTAFYDSK